MRIGIIVRILWSAGTQKFAINQAIALTKAGHDVTLIFLRKSKSGEVYDEILNQVKHKVITAQNNSLFAPVYDFLTGIFMSNRKGEGRVDYNLLRRLPKYVKDMNLDFLICQDQWAGLGGYYCHRKLGIKYAVVIHEQINNFPWIKGIKRIFVFLALRWQKKILFNSKAIFTETDAVAQTVSNFYSGRLKVKAIFPGLTNRIEFNYKEKKNQIVAISYWNEIKVPEVYLNIFKAIEGYNFIIAGNWISESYRNQYIEKLREQGVLEKVTFIDHMSEQQKMQVLHESKFFIRLGLDEKGPGYGTIEALEAGLPVICNTGLGIAGYLKEKSFALVLDNANDVGKVRTFVQQSDNGDKYNALQEDISAFLKDFSWESHVSQLIQALEGETRERRN